MAVYIGNDDRICANSGMRADLHRSEYFRTRPDIDVASDLRDSAQPAAAQSHLMEDQAVDANFRVGMNDNAVGMRDEQAAPDLTGKRDICAGDDAPKAVAQDKNLAEKNTEDTSASAPKLMASDRKKKLPPRIPELPWNLTRPIWNLGADLVHRFV
jgi:hypothetical protein